MTGRLDPYSLAGLTYLTHLELGGLTEGVATGGSISTLVDTVFLTSAYVTDDYFNGGTCWILNGGASDNGNEVARISDTTTGTQTIALADNIAAVEALAQYALADRRYPLLSIISALNHAIYSLGKIIYTRTADYIGVASQTEYTLVEQSDAGDLPVVIDADAEVLEVWLQTKLNDSNDNQWVRYDGAWYIQKANIGTMNTLVFDYNPLTTHALKVVLRGQHPALFQYGARAHTTLDQGVPFQLVALRAAYHLLQNELANDISHPRLVSMMTRIAEMEAKAQTEHTPLRVRRTPKVLNIYNPRYTYVRDEFRQP